MLRLEVAKQLAKSNPRFVALSQGGSAALDLSKTDMNQLLQQLGVAEGLYGQQQRAQTGAAETQGTSGSGAPSGASTNGDNNGN